MRLHRSVDFGGTPWGLETRVYGQVKSWVDDGLKPRAVTVIWTGGFLFL